MAHHHVADEPVGVAVDVGVVFAPVGVNYVYARLAFLLCVDIQAEKADDRGDCCSEIFHSAKIHILV